MSLQITWDEQGVWFCPVHQDSPCFPLKYSGPTVPHDWELQCRAEQLWYREALDYDETRQSYLLPMKQFSELSREEKQFFHLPYEPTELGIAEVGNLGSARYEIRWFPLANGRPVGKVSRTGAILTWADRQTVLSPQQLEVVEAIASYEDTKNIQYRAFFCAYLSTLARRAGTSLKRANQYRIFYYVDQVDVYLTLHPEGRKIVPYFRELPPELRRGFSAPCPSRLQGVYGGKQATIFVSPSAQKNYDLVAAMPAMDEMRYQKFLMSPQTFLPDGVFCPASTPAAANPKEHKEHMVFPFSVTAVPIAMDPSARKQYLQQRSDRVSADILWKLCSHPVLCKPVWDNLNADGLRFASPKLEWTVRTIFDCFSAGKKVLILTKYPRMQAILRLVIEAQLERGALTVCGSYSKRKEIAVQTFLDQPMPDVLIASPESLSWLNLSGISALIFYTWSPDIEANYSAFSRMEADTLAYRPYMTMPEGKTVEDPS